MKVESWLFVSGVGFFAPIAVAYWIVTEGQEPLGVTGLVLTAGMCLMIGGYLWATGQRVDPRPEDDDFGRIETEAGDLGEFAPQSIWPLFLAASGAVIFFGMATAWWVMAIGLVLTLLSACGWVYEFYLGEHSH